MSLQKYRADKAGETQSDGATPWYCHWMGGPTLALVRNCRCENRPEITPRTVYVRGESDTRFSIPAACRVKGRTVTGYLTSVDGQYVFRAHAHQLGESHWAYGSGSAGCLYDNGPHAAPTLRAAIEGALFIFSELPAAELKRARKNLRTDGIHYFSTRYRAEAGADYVEVSQQAGPCPESDE